MQKFPRFARSLRSHTRLSPGTLRSPPLLSRPPPARAQQMHQLSTEKVRIAATASDMVRHLVLFSLRDLAFKTAQVSGYIRSLDRDLGSFADELVIQAREAEAEALAAQAQRDAAPPVGHPGSGHTTMYGAPTQPYGGPQPYGYAPQRGAYPPDVSTMAPPQYAPSRAPRAHEGGGPPLPRRRALLAGDQVAANTAESGENWIVTTFIGISSGASVVPEECVRAQPLTRAAQPATCMRFRTRRLSQTRLTATFWRHIMCFLCRAPRLPKTSVCWRLARRCWASFLALPRSIALLCLPRRAALRPASLMRIHFSLRMMMRLRAAAWLTSDTSSLLALRKEVTDESMTTAARALFKKRSSSSHGSPHLVAAIGIAQYYRMDASSVGWL